MIKELMLKNFKCFKSEELFSLGNINLFTGINGKGKSTVLQTFLLFHQSKSLTLDLNKLVLNGFYINLGTYEDLKNSFVSSKENIEIQINYYDNQQLFPVNYLLKEFEEDEGIAGIERINSEKPIEELIEIENKFLKKIHYVAADRIGPKKYYDKYTPGSFINVGSKGEYTTNVLYKKEKELVHNSLYLGNDQKTLITQTEEWLKKIFGSAKIEIKGKERESSVLNLLLNSSQNEKRYKPFNVGFGYTYILPIIVSGLIAKKGEILIVENPEAHLHPKAQSEIAKFLALVASCGVQVFIESHSEHILNGLRIAGLSHNYKVSTDDINIFYFLQDGENDKHFEELKIEKDGKIKNWPLGFFDQQEEDLNEIFRLGRQK